MFMLIIEKVSRATEKKFLGDELFEAFFFLKNYNFHLEKPYTQHNGDRFQEVTFKLNVPQ